MPAYEELNVLVDEVNTEVAELDQATAAEVEAAEILAAAQVVVTEQEAQVEQKLDILLEAVQNRLAELRGETVGAPPPA